MAIRSVDEIINLSDSSKNPEKLAFKDLVKHIDPRIRDRAPRHNSLHFSIPGILWGQPVFSAHKVQKMIVRHYTSIGFRCVKLDNRELIIKWGDDDSQSQGSHDSADQDSDSTSTDSDGDSDSDGATDSSDGSNDSTGSSESAETSGTDVNTTDSDDDGDEDSKTKCVTVEQIPLSKRLSIINNQLHQNM